MADHRGQAKLRTFIAEFKEKRFCRALFNLGQVSGLGRVIDYEVPLKAVRGAKHGNIDLLCSEGISLLVVEAKKPSSKESLLRAVLEAFTYSTLVTKERAAFSQGLRPSPRNLARPGRAHLLDRNFGQADRQDRGVSNDFEI